MQQYITDKLSEFFLSSWGVLEVKIEPCTLTHQSMTDLESLVEDPLCLYLASDTQ